MGGRIPGEAGLIAAPTTSCACSGAAGVPNSGGCVAEDGPASDIGDGALKSAQSFSGYFFENAYCASKTSFNAGYTCACTAANSL